MKHVITIIMTLAITASTHAFVLMGPTPDQDEYTLNTGNAPNFVAIGSSNVGRDRYMGTPKHRTRFFRLSTPYLTYGYDTSFVRFFGQEGIDAIDDAMRVINDYFEPEDGSYSGISSINLNNSGFEANYATYWLNMTAQNESLIDMKSVTLGYMVNMLGLGNPHRYAFTAYELDNNMTAGLGTAIIRTKNNNYDPIDPINTGLVDTINGVQYSYRLVHNQPAGLSLSTFAAWPTLNIDMEEYTTDSSGNEFSAVAGILDAFYGATDIAWVSPPSQFNYGVYYDRINASGGIYQPRHALTLDDAGGLKYLYDTNTLAMEYNPHNLVAPADYVGGVQAAYNQQNSLLTGSGGRSPRPGNEVRLAPSPINSIFQNQRRSVFPMRNQAGIALGNNLSIPANSPIFSLLNVPGGLGTFMAGAAPTLTGDSVNMMRWAYRGGVDKIKLVKLTYDSLLDATPNGTNFVWHDTFITNLNVNIPNSSGLPGAGNVVAGRPQYFTQIVGRNVAAPDVLFTARDLTPINGIPVAFENNATFDYNATSGANVVGGYAAGNPVVVTPNNANLGSRPVVVDAGRGVFAANNTPQNPQSARALGAADNGPGIWAPNDSATTFSFTFDTTYNIGGFEVLWSGELTVDGNGSVPAINNQQWAYIYGPGPNDFHKFPDNLDYVGAQSYYSEFENSILPVTGVPTITLVSKNGRNTPIGNNSLYRTTDTLTIKGRNLRNATAVEILSESGATVELIYPVSAFIKNDTLIEIPAQRLSAGASTPLGGLSIDTEGTSRRLKVWNTLGPSELNPNPFAIKTGPVVLTGTSVDGNVYYRDEVIILNGYGFKSFQVSAEDGNATLSHMQIIDATGNPVYPSDGNSTEVTAFLQVVSDNKAYLSAGAIPTTADGIARRMMFSRGNSITMSNPQINPMSVVSGAPSVSQVAWYDYVGNPAGNPTVVGSLDTLGQPEELRRDYEIRITGQGLYTVESIQLVRESGIPFDPPVRIHHSEFNTKGVVRRTDGTLITIPKNAFENPTADGFGSSKVKLLVTNGKDTALYSQSFNVNIQLNITGISGFSSTTYGANNRNLYDRTSDEIIITGNGLRAVSQFLIEAENTLLNSPTTKPSITMTSVDSTSGVQWSYNPVTKLETLKLSMSDVGYGAAAWTDAGGADSNEETDLMLFELLHGDSNRTDGFALAGSSFLVGEPPSVTGYALNPNRGTGANPLFFRDDSNMTLAGIGLHIIDQIEFVDQNNVTLPAPAGLEYQFNVAQGVGNHLRYDYASSPNVVNYGGVIPVPGAATTGTQLEINGTLIPYDRLLTATSLFGAVDSLVDNSRLIKLTTPWGSTSMHVTGNTAMRIHSRPQFSPPNDYATAGFQDGWGTIPRSVATNIEGDDTLAATFATSYGTENTGWALTQPESAGGIDINATNGASQNFVINGAGFLSVERIQFVGRAGAILANGVTQPVDLNMSEPNITNTGAREVFIDTGANPGVWPPAVSWTITQSQITIPGSWIGQQNATWAEMMDFNATPRAGFEPYGGPRQIILYTSDNRKVFSPLFKTDWTVDAP